MKLGRRDFLKVSGAATGFTILHSLTFTRPVNAGAYPDSLSNIAMMIDVSKCVGCWWCYAACKNCNCLSETTRPDPEDPPELTAHTWTTAFTLHKGEDEWSFRKHACMHCIDASCEQVCPTGAISHQGAAVVINQDWCIGCGYCVQACPFDVPHKDEHGGTVRKCTFCIDRVSNGEQPACADACPTGAIQFGQRSDLLTAARERVKELKSDGHPNTNLYGEYESGGLHVIYVLTDRPSVYGLPEEVHIATSQAAFKWLAGVTTATVVAIIPFWFLFKRKSKLENNQQNSS